MDCWGHYFFEVVQEVTKGYPIFQSKVLDPYPQLNGGQQLGALEACPIQTVTVVRSTNRPVSRVYFTNIFTYEKLLLRGAQL